MVKKAEIPRHIVDCALELAAKEGWRRTRLSDIAQAAGVSLADLYGHYPSKTAILTAYFERIDAETLAGVDPELKAEAARDRLFDVIMRRFDAMKPHKEGLRAVLRGIDCDPCAVLWGWCRLRRSLVWMLEAANLDSSGLCGAIRVKGLGLVYLPTLRVWLRDESEDMAKTMAALDRRLARIDDVLSALRGSRRRGTEEAGMSA